MKNIAICIPAGCTVPTEFMRSVVQLIEYEIERGKTQVKYFDTIHYNVAVNREFLADYMLKVAKPDYMLFLDTDVIFPRNTIERLLKYDKDIVGGVYFTKKEPFLPVIRRLENNKYMKIYDIPDEDPFRVDGIGFGMMLIKREVFERTQKPWFFNKHDSVSEDLYFCKKALNNGFDIWATTRLGLGHGLEVQIKQKHYEWKKHTIDRKEHDKIDEASSSNWVGWIL
jgi:hypothetical protein